MYTVNQSDFVFMAFCVFVCVVFLAVFTTNIMSTKVKQQEIADKHVLKVVYPRNKHANNGGYDAIGVCEVFLEKDDERLTDKCAFSQYTLSECESIAALVYSMSAQSVSQGNKWQYLCDGDFSKIHLFDTEYLKRWIDIKGCEFMHCPLCRTGVIEEKEHIEEHEIESMQQLKVRRDEAKKENDEYLIFFVEQLILDKAVSEVWNISNDAHTQQRRAFNQEIVRETMVHWVHKKKIDEFRAKILESVEKCIECDNLRILKIICKHCGYESGHMRATEYARNAEYMRMLDYCAKYASFDCLTYLLKAPQNLNWSEQKRPSLLLNAVKWHPENLEMINLMMDKLEELKITFVCDEVMQYVIKADLVEVAKRIVNNRWHKICKKDEQLAESINLQIHLYFESRNAAIHHFDPNVDSENLLNLDDDDWGADNADDDDDDDWANADD
mmetsp:Transcript_40427/g.64822  ORF Transcript_40427/g.64822 Transcript_40427/m.64822 type:complete len:442 (-) Transcript_40427:191-1516(-)